jgi:hypothetical protein
MVRSQSGGELFAIKIGIAGNFAKTFSERATRPSRRAERVDAGAKIDKFAAIDAGVSCPTIDVAAVVSMERPR